MCLDFLIWKEADQARLCSLRGPARFLPGLLPGLVKVSPEAQGVWRGHAAKPHRCDTVHPRPEAPESGSQDKSRAPGQTPGGALSQLCQVPAAGPWAGQQAGHHLRPPLYKGGGNSPALKKMPQSRPGGSGFGEALCPQVVFQN